MDTALRSPVLKPFSQVDGPYQLHSLDRAVSVLEVLAESDTPVSLAELCQRMGLHKSTAHRSLMVLERCALIDRVQNNRFRLGLRLYELGNRALEQIDLRTRARPFLQRLSIQVGETVQLGILQKTSVVYLGKVELNRKLRKGSKPGVSNPVYCTASGKAMLAFQPTETLEEIVSKIRFVRYTQQTLYSREILFKALEKVRRVGYAVDNEEVEVGMRSVGAPILNGALQAVAAVNVSGPTSRIAVRDVPVIAEHLLRCCQDISTSLGLQIVPPSVSLRRKQSPMHS